MQVEDQDELVVMQMIDVNSSLPADSPQRGKNMRILEANDALRQDANRTSDIPDKNSKKDVSNLLMKRPKKFDVRKKLQFQNGVMVPSSKTEKEAVKLGRQIAKDIDKVNMVAGLDHQHIMESNKTNNNNKLAGLAHSSISMPVGAAAALASPKRTAPTATPVMKSGFPL